MNTNKNIKGLIQAELVGQRQRGMFARAKSWSPNGEKRDNRKARRDWKRESRNIG